MSQACVKKPLIELKSSSPTHEASCQHFSCEKNAQEWDSDVLMHVGEFESVISKAKTTVSLWFSVLASREKMLEYHTRAIHWVFLSTIFPC